MRILGLVVIANACANPAPTPVTPAVAQPDCSAVVAATARFVADQRPREAERIKSVVALRCVEDHWSTAAITCISGAASTEAAHGCVRENLTVAQNERFMHELSADGEVNREPVPKPDAPSGLRISAIDPDRGDADGGTYVRIIGEGFLTAGPRNVKVYFGSHQGTVVRFASDTELIVQAPGGKVGDEVGVLAIFEPGGEQKLMRAFTYVDKTGVGPPPTAPGSQASLAAKVNDDGKVLFARGNFAAASSRFREAVARVPEAKYFLNLCLSLFKEGKFAEAQIACYGGTKNDPDRATAAKLKATMDEVLREAKAQHIDLVE